jgi:hypothetical protein
MNWKRPLDVVAAIGLGIGGVLGVQGAIPSGSPGSAWAQSLISILDKTDTHLGMIVSWVPAAFVDTVQRGINVECMGMINWAAPPRRMDRSNIDFAVATPGWLELLAADLERR